MKLSNSVVHSSSVGLGAEVRCDGSGDLNSGWEPSRRRFRIFGDEKSISAMGFETIFLTCAGSQEFAQSVREVLSNIFRPISM